MTKHKNLLAYPVKPNPVLTDKFTGFDSETIKQETVTYQFSDVQDLILSGVSPIIGGTLKITEIVYTGVLTTPESVANQLTAKIVLSYEIVIFTVNNDKYQLKKQDVTIGVLQTPLVASDFITITLIAKNLAVGISTYKGLNFTTKREEHYSIGSIGFSIAKELDGLGVETGKILFEQIEQTSLGAGVKVYKGLNSTSKLQEFRTILYDSQDGFGESMIRDFQENDNDITVRGKKLQSDDIILSSTDKIIKLSLPTTSSIQALIVNNLYAPTYIDWVNAGGNLVSNPSFIFRGKGTASQPFTDSVNYTSSTTKITTADTAIQNAINGDTVYSFVGIGTPNAPSKTGQTIIIKDNNGIYNYAGTLNYNTLKIQNEGFVNSTTSGYILDMDSSSAFLTTGIITINNLENAIFKVQNNAFLNSGTGTATNNYINTKTVNLLGDGLIYSDTNDISKYIINSNPDGILVANNDGGLTFNIKCKLKSTYGGVYKVGGASRIDLFSEILSGQIGIVINSALKAFYQTGGVVRAFNNCSFTFNGTRQDAFTFIPTNGYIPSFIGLANFFYGNSTNLFTKTNTLNSVIDVTSSNSGYGLNITNIFETPSLMSNVNFRNNLFLTGSIDVTKADITQGNNISSVNFLAGVVLETLVKHVSKTAAKLAGLPMNSAFLKYTDVNAVDLLQGVEYKVKFAGTPSLGTVGNYFVATGSETGTGIATLYQREILI